MAMMLPIRCGILLFCYKRREGWFTKISLVGQRRDHYISIYQRTDPLSALENVLLRVAFSVLRCCWCSCGPSTQCDDSPTSRGHLVYPVHDSKRGGTHLCK